VSVLVDTSVWIDHFRSGNAALANLVGSDLALTHPMVIVELACGTPPAPREQTLGSLSLLRSCNQATLDEVNYLWSEYRYRHELCWSAVLKISLGVVTLVAASGA